jgi:hypothetical protein
MSRPNYGATQRCSRLRWGSSCDGPDERVAIGHGLAGVHGAVRRRANRSNQEELAAANGISVTPLREAIRRVAAEGFIVLAAHRDARVAPLSPEEARSLSEMRAALESLAAGLAAERIDTFQRVTLDALADVTRRVAGCQSSVMTTLPLARPCSTYPSASRVWSNGNVLSMSGRRWPAS